MAGIRFRWGPALYRHLNGVFCIYKPTGLPVYKVLEIIQGNLARDVNALPCYKYERKEYGLSQSTGVSDVTDTKLPSLATLPANMEDLSQHRLSWGPRYIPDDFVISKMHGLSRHTSGVLVIGLGRGCEYLEHIALARYLRVYHVRGRLGWATDNFSPKGRILERTSFRHVKKSILDKVCAKAQANHTKYMFEYAGVEQDSQEAYELAQSGLVRPESGKTPPMLYGVKCIEFDPPDFTLEIHAINEKDPYMRNLIHDIGLSVKSTAVCTHIRRVRYGHFTLDHALLRKHWTAENILDNMDMCRDLLTPDKLLTGSSVEQNHDISDRLLGGGGYGRLIGRE